MGQPTKRSPGELVIVSFKVKPDLLQALDAETERQTAEQGPGRTPVNRTELIRSILYDWLERQQRKGGGRPGAGRATK